MSLPYHIRVRCADNDPLIFERPSAQPKVARNLMVLMTGVGWTVWAYLWRPALTLGLWFFGVDSARFYWGGAAEWHGVVDFVLYVMPYGWALCAALLVWAFINYLRFRGSERRKARPLATVDADAEWAGLSPEVLIEGRQLKRIVCCHDEEGHLVGILAPMSPLDDSELSPLKSRVLLSP